MSVSAARLFLGGRSGNQPIFLLYGMYSKNLRSS